MATDYDAPRRTETEDLNEDSLEELDRYYGEGYGRELY